MRMLICYDGSALSRSAMEKSIAILGSAKPEVILVTVVVEPADASSYEEAAFEELRAKGETDLRAAAEWVVQQGLDVNVILAVGISDPRKMLVETVRKTKPDVVVITSRPPKGGVRFGKVNVSISDYLIHHIDDCPVLVMH